ncbi:hypothetical protein BDR03DRAFT_351695 [Suillus americanus]|nr:hypothetical protein BDR03DRAFT_351695 [Suillus americanus]
MHFVLLSLANLYSAHLIIWSLTTYYDADNFFSILQGQLLPQRQGPNRLSLLKIPSMISFFATSTRSILIIEKTQTRHTVWAVIGRFADFNLADELDGPKIHQLQNVLTLMENWHFLRRPSHMVGSNSALRDLNMATNG